MNNPIQGQIPAHVAQTIKAAFAKLPAGEIARLGVGNQFMPEIIASIGAANQRMNNLISYAGRTPRLRKRFIPDRSE